LPLAWRLLNGVSSLSLNVGNTQSSMVNGLANGGFSAVLNGTVVRSPPEYMTPVSEPATIAPGTSRITPAVWVPLPAAPRLP
jgi:hypothetical protein